MRENSAGRRSEHSTLRGDVLAIASGRALEFFGPRDSCSVIAPWPIWSCELSCDGSHALALSEDGREGRVWTTDTGGVVRDLEGDVSRHSLRAGFATIDGRLFVVADSRRRSLSLVPIDSASDGAAINLSGLATFRLERVVDLGAGFIGLHGSRHAEQYYTGAVLPGRSLLSDTEALQSVLRSSLAPWWWGYELAIGPGPSGQVVVAKNPEWDADQGAPERLDEDLRGFVFWDPTLARVVDRLPWHGPIPNAGTIGADADRIAIERRDGVELISRATGESRVIEAIALDPYRMVIARRRGGGVEVVAIDATDF